MNDTFSIDLPEDKDGFVLFQCHSCGEYFKLHEADIKEIDIEKLYCPQCGFTGDDFLTPAALKIAEAKLENDLTKELMGELERLANEINSLGEFFKLQVEAECDGVPEIAEISNSGIESMVAQTMQCCTNRVKMRTELIKEGYYCPYCGSRHKE